MKRLSVTMNEIEIKEQERNENEQDLMKKIDLLMGIDEFNIFIN